MPKVKKSLLEIQDRSASSIPCSFSPSDLSVADSFNLYSILYNKTSIKQRGAHNLLTVEVEIKLILSFAIIWV